MKIISFYSDCAIKLESQCLQFDMEYEILNENYGTTWIENTRAKPTFILKMLSKMKENERVLWIDVDSVFLKKFDFETTAEWSCVYRDATYPFSFAHCIQNTQRTRDFLKKWISEIDIHKRGDHSAFINIHTEICNTSIPDGYFLFEESTVKSKFEYFNNL